MNRVVYWMIVAISARFLLEGGSVCGFNINTKDIKVFSGSSDSFFGFSLALLTTSREKWLLVGAPKGQDPLQRTVKSPGVVFRCPLDGNRTDCTQITIDPTGYSEVSDTFYDEVITFRQHKTDQFLGFSLAVSPDNKHILACAPKWTDDGGYLYMFGMCYEVGADFSGNSRLLPMLVDRAQLYEGSIRLWIYASLGFSAQYTKGGRDLVVAAPGLYSWTGGFAIEEDRIQKSEYMPGKQYGTSTPLLIGYSMATTERLDASGSTYIVAGAPKRKMSGAVFVFSYKQRDPQKEIVGEQIGSFFGYAVCVVDVNNDNLDDIVIGAPFYTSNKTEEGRVHVWLNKGQLKFEQQKEVMTGPLASKARFGSAIANIRDFNKDSFNDVAIGAPYEDNGIGALYIYNGCNTGLWPKFTQRIPGSLVDPGIRAFGASLSQPSLSTDGVFAVGAYDANKAAVLRSNPVVRVHARMYVSPSVISIATSNLTVSVCFQYTNRSRITVDDIALEYSLTVDTMLPPGATRAYLTPDNTALVTRTFLSKSTETCEQLNLIAPFQDILRDVGLLVRYNLSPSAASSCVRDCPTLEAFNGHNTALVDTREVKMTLQYDKLCGQDNKCDPRLSIEVKPRLAADSQIVVGRDTLLTSNVIIRNEGEPAYNIMVHVDVVGNLSTPLRTLEQSGTSLVDCSRRASTAADASGDVDAYQCIVRRPYPLGSNVSMTFAVQFPLANHVDLATFAANVSVMVADEQKPQAAAEIGVPIKRFQSIKIESSSDPDQAAVRTEGSSKASTDIVHKYSIRNLGPSPLQMAEISVYVPIAGTENEVTVEGNPVSLTTYDTVPAKVHICHGQKGDVRNPAVLTDDRNLTCATTTCQRYVCKMQTFQKDQYVLVSVRASIRHTIIKRFKDDAGIILGTLVILPKNPNGTDTRSEASTFFYKTSKVSVAAQTSFPLWQVIVGSIGALIVLIIAGALMIKFGCFRRSSKADMQKRRSARLSRMIPAGQLEPPPAAAGSRADLVSR